jgi:hypothetical protein
MVGNSQEESGRYIRKKNPDFEMLPDLLFLVPQK